MNATGGTTGTDPTGGCGVFVLSLWGGSGCGKSTLAKALCEGVGHQVAARIPTDYYLESNPFASSAEFFAHPLAYDWDAVAAALAAREGAERSTPDYDFVAFRRKGETGGPAYVIRPLMIVDVMRPYRGADLAILLDAPDHERRRRIVARDARWGTQVIAHWAQHQFTLAAAMGEVGEPDLVLDATRPIEANVARIIARLADTRIAHLLLGAAARD